MNDARVPALRPCVLVLGMLAALVALLPAAPASAAPLSGVDLSTYVRVARLNLPEPTRTTAPAGSLLAQEASGVTYDWDTDSLFVVGDGGTSVVQVDKTTGALIDSMTLAAGSSPAGTEFYDTEGITYLGNGDFAFTEERYRQIDKFHYVPSTTLTRAGVQTVKLGTTIGNTGLEGVSNDPQTGGLILAKETEPESIFQTDVGWAAGTATNGSPTTDESTDLFTPSLAGLSDFSDVYALSNVTTLSGADTSHLLMISQESGKVINIARDGTVASTLTIHGDADNPLSVPAQTMEGVTMDRDGTLYIVNEEGGGDVNHPQLWAYQPSTVPNAAPTAVALTHQTTTLSESTSTTTPVKVADVDVTDADQIGTNDLTVTGPDAQYFDVDNNGLYLKAGTALDAATKSSYSVTVSVDDPGVGSTPDAVSSTYTLTITPAGASGPETVVVSEVSPTGSSNSTYRADWFELTNTGSAPVDLTAWKMDDNSHDPNLAVALTGVSSLAPGESAVFFEGTAATTTAFATAWFGSDVPAGLQVGYYEGAGVGLSSGGDEVNIYNSTDTQITGIGFGAATAGVSFDNAAGAGSASQPDPVVTARSAVGANGGFTSATGGETGSPGAVNVPLAITEVSPTGSSAEYGGDWFELTNTGPRSVSLTGFGMDDSSNDPVQVAPLSGVTSIAPGESVVFIEGTATKAQALKASWFGDHAADGPQVGSYVGSGVGLSSGGDEVHLFDAGGNRVTGVAFGATTTGVSLDNAAGLGSTGATAPDPPVISTPSVAGVYGAWASHGETGSPGQVAYDLSLTEVSPTGSSTTTYRADWFELTNDGASPVPVGSFKMDDNSNAYANAVPMAGVSTIAPGDSVVFVEGTAATATAFVSAWFGSDVPAGLQVGSYTGSGVGLSASGDAVNVFDGGGTRVTGVSFAAATTGVSFDNSAARAGSATLPLPGISALSVAGVHGAWVAGGETGSPGTVADDDTAPVIAYAGNAGTYLTTDQITIACAASDEARGSGVASTDCADVSGTGASFGLGTHTITTTATDHAGNVGTGSVTFTVTAPVVDRAAGRDGGDSGTTTPPPVPPVTNPAPVPVIPPARPAAPAAPAAPKLATPTSMKATSLADGVTTSLTNLKPGSKITLVVRLGGRTIATITAKADKKGRGAVKLRLTKAERAKVKGRTVTLRYTVVGPDGRTKTINKTVRVR